MNHKSILSELTLSIDAASTEVLASEAEEMYQREVMNELFNRAVIEDRSIATAEALFHLDMDEPELPPELHNTPFETRPERTPEIYSCRPYFLFSTTSKGVACVAGTSSVVKKIKDRELYLSCRFTPVYVYDRYGLNMTYSYVRRVLSLGCEEYQLETAVYMLGSLVMLCGQGPNIEGFRKRLDKKQEIASVLVDVCRLFFELLTLLEQNEPVLPEPLTSDNCVVLPIEILARIFRSKRIDKKTSALFSAEQQKRDLREGELMCRGLLSPIACVNDSNWNCSLLAANLSEGRVVMGPHGYVYDKMANAAVANSNYIRPILSKIIAYQSWLDYARIVGRPAREVLEQVTLELDLTDIVTVCTWVLLLICSSVPRSVECDELEKVLPEGLSQGREMNMEELLALFWKLHKEALAL